MQAVLNEEAFGKITTMEAPNDNKERRVEDYLDGFFSKQLMESQLLELPETSFTLLSASQKSEVAHEFLVDEKSRGAFTQILLDELQRNNGNVSYQELLLSARTAISKRFKNQRPELFATGNTPVNRIFLSHLKTGTLDPPLKYIVHFHEGKWLLEVGLIDEYQLGMTFRNTPLELALDGRVIGTARTGNMTLDQCEIEPNFSANPEQVYQTQLHYQRNTRLNVTQIGKSEIVTPFLNWVKTQDDLGFQLTQKEEEADYLLDMINSRSISLMDQLRQIHTFPVNTNNPVKTYNSVAKALQHIARWHNISQFDNPYSAYQEEVLQIALERRDVKSRAANEDTPLQVLLDKGETKLPYSFNIQGGGTRPFHYTILLLRTDFSISVIKEGNYSGKSIEEDIDISFNQVGQHVLKVLFSSDPIRSDLLRMAPLHFTEDADQDSR